MNTQTKNFLLSKGMWGGIGLILFAVVMVVTKEAKFVDMIEPLCLGIGLIGVRVKQGGIAVGRGNGVDDS